MGKNEPDKKTQSVKAVCKERRETRDQLQNQKFKELTQELKNQKNSIKGYIAKRVAATNRE